MGAFSNMDYELQSSEAAVSDAFTEDDANRTGTCPRCRHIRDGTGMIYADVRPIRSTDAASTTVSVSGKSSSTATAR